MASGLATREFGEGFPILIVHGWQMDARVEELDFEPIFVDVTGYRRIYVDLPGMGKTPANGVKDLDEMYLRLVQFIDSRFAKSRFLLAGSSCGGYLAEALAQRYINQVDGLFLRVPLIEPRDDKRDLDSFKPVVADNALMASMSTEDKTMLGNVIVQTPAYIATLKAKYTNAVVPAVEASDMEVLDPIRADPDRYQLSASLTKERAILHAPTLIVCGRQDETVGYRDSLRLLEFYSRSTYVVLDRGTHGLPVDETSLFAALVRDWIFRVDEWRDQSGK